MVVKWPKFWVYDNNGLAVLASAVDIQENDYAGIPLTHENVKKIFGIDLRKTGGDLLYAETNGPGLKIGTIGINNNCTITIDECLTINCLHIHTWQL